MSTTAEQWRQLGKAFIDNADELVSLESNDGEGVTFEDLKKTFRFLEHYGFVEGHNTIGLSPTPLLLDIASALSREETRRRVVPDVDDWLAQLRLDTGHYHAALSLGDDKDMRRYLQNIRNSVLRMRFALRQEIHSIQHFLQTQFGHVATINQKIAENRYLIERTSQLTARLLFINDKGLGSLANDNSVLLRVLVLRFLPDIQQFREEILAIIPQLEKMLWSFRKQDEKTRCLWAVSRHLSQGESLLDRDLDSLELLNSPFNILQSEPDVAGINVDDPELQEVLIDLVKRLPERAGLSEEGAKREEVGLYDPEDDDDDEEEHIEPCFLLPHRRAFIASAIQHQWSAKRYWDKEGEAGVPYPVWLQWIYSELDGEPGFNMELTTIEGGEFVGNVLISDLTIAPEKEATL
ncbi:hypothetical protein [Endozoicomonas ascidiicola]|uniref:hypothetical protein n=1 Tax=Endozoicomonas ascidiicola TaxID=1698521 RepID=UPI00083089B6|nr:hypothetical protein [Endozoicomonas ascidiicola]USN26966.1 hypothetical protein [synthetic construct]